MISRSIFRGSMSMFIGVCAPILGVYFLYGIDVLLEVIDTLFVHEIIIWYTAVCAVVFFALGFLRHRINYEHDWLDSLHNFVLDVFCDLSGSIVALLKLMAGLLITMSVMAFIYDYKHENVAGYSYLLTIGVMALIDFLVISWAVNYVKKNWMRKNINYCN